MLEFLTQCNLASIAFVIFLSFFVSGVFVTYLGFYQKSLFKQLVGGTELEDSQKQRFHISRSFSSDTCQGNRQNKECRAETAYKSAKREKRSSF